MEAVGCWPRGREPCGRRRSGFGTPNGEDSTLRARTSPGFLSLSETLSIASSSKELADNFSQSARIEIEIKGPPPGGLFCMEELFSSVAARFPKWEESTDDLQHNLLVFRSLA
jgi:hypothetical protein